jgi:hypothetical protein
VNYDLQIRPLPQDDMENVIQLSLLAWAPVFQSFEQVLGSKIFSLIYPEWKKSQKEIVEKICRDEKTQTWVAELQGKVTGFIAYALNSRENGQDNTGEVELLAVCQSTKKGRV